VTGNYRVAGRALLVCPTGDKAFSGSSDTSNGAGALIADRAMPNADGTGYQYVVGTDAPNLAPFSTDIAVTCASVS
jgi:hypothetical protein